MRMNCGKVLFSGGDGCLRHSVFLTKSCLCKSFSSAYFINVYKMWQDVSKMNIMSILSMCKDSRENTHLEERMRTCDSGTIMVMGVVQLG